jgi:hypothetical protein
MWSPVNAQNRQVEAGIENTSHPTAAQQRTNKQPASLPEEPKGNAHRSRTTRMGIRVLKSNSSPTSHAGQNTSLVEPSRRK